MKTEWVLILGGVLYIVVLFGLLAVLETYFPTDYSSFPVLSRPALTFNFCVALGVAGLVFLSIISFLGYKKTEKKEEIA